MVVMSRSIIDYRFRFFVFFKFLKPQSTKHFLREWYAISTVYMLFLNKAFDGDFCNSKKLLFLAFPKFQLLKPQTIFLEFCVAVHLSVTID